MAEPLKRSASRTTREIEDDIRPAGDADGTTRGETVILGGDAPESTPTAKATAAPKTTAKE